MNEIIWKKAFDSGIAYQNMQVIKSIIVNLYVDSDDEEVKELLDKLQDLTEATMKLLKDEE